MKQQIYLSLFVAVGLLSACGQQSPMPTTPTPTPTPLAVVPTSPSPVASAPPTSATVPGQIPTVKSTPTTAPFTVTTLPTSLYPAPTPIATPVPAASVKTKANPKPEPLAKLIIPTDPAQQITPTGIGSAKIGMSFKQLKEQMGTGFEFPIKTSFIEGFDAIAVTKAGKVQYYIPYPAGTNFTDQDRIEHLITDNPNYRTEQGVGPGTPIDRAATVYGSATLSMSKENESREFISFSQNPNGLAFRPKPAKTRTFAGDYPESNDEYLKTQKYDNKAAIGQITVSCAEDQCNKE